MIIQRRKYDYYKIIQQHFDTYGWEDVSYYEAKSTGYVSKETKALIKHDLYEYARMGHPVRVIFRKEKKDE